MNKIKYRAFKEYNLDQSWKCSTATFSQKSTEKKKNLIIKLRVSNMGLLTGYVTT